jgi:phage terminase Nu1 subunit (DNA packaging protein)
MDEITTTRLAKLFDTTPKTVADLGKRGIIEKGEKRGTWLLQPSVAGYVRHLRAEAAGRGGEEGATARARLGEAQADLATTRAAKLRGELVETDAVEKLWTSKLRAFIKLTSPICSIFSPSCSRSLCKLGEACRHGRA